MAGAFVGKYLRRVATNWRVGDGRRDLYFRHYIACLTVSHLTIYSSRT
jgi:hypothetical protein